MGASSLTGVGTSRGYQSPQLRPSRALTTGLRTTHYWKAYKVVSLLKFTWDEGEDSFLACPPQLTLAIGQREVAVPYRWGRVRLCKRYGVICTATPRHPGRPIMSHARAGRCATGVHRCFMRPGVSTPAVRDATARRVALARGRVASFSSGASAAADDQDPPCRLKSGWLRHRRAPPH